MVVNDCNDALIGTLLESLSNYLQLPSLREFHGQKIGSLQEGADKRLARLEPVTISLVHLETRESQLNATDLTIVLRASKNLKTLSYELSQFRYTRGNYSIPELSAALCWTEGRLENLWLDYEGGNAMFSHADLSPLSSLSSFKVPKNLRVPMYLFSGIDGVGTTWFGPDGQGPAPDLTSLMPSSIETLYFSKTEGRIKVLTSVLQKLLQAKDSCTPQLQRIAFEADVTGKDDAFDYSCLDVPDKEAGS